MPLPLPVALRQKVRQKVRLAHKELCTADWCKGCEGRGYPERFRLCCKAQLAGGGQVFWVRHHSISDTKVETLTLFLDTTFLDAIPPPMLCSFGLMLTTTPHSFQSSPRLVALILWPMCCVFRRGPLGIRPPKLLLPMVERWSVGVTVQARTLSEAKGLAEGTPFFDPQWWTRLTGDGTTGQESGTESLKMEVKVLDKGILLDNGPWVFTRTREKEVFRGRDKTKVTGQQQQAAADCLCAVGWNSGKRPSPTVSLNPSAWWHGTNITDRRGRRDRRDEMIWDMRPSQARPRTEGQTGT